MVDFISNYPEWDLLPSLNDVDLDSYNIIDIKVVKTDKQHPCLVNKALVYDDDTWLSKPSFSELVDDNSSVDSLSSTGNASFLSTFETFQTAVV